MLDPTDLDNAAARLRATRAAFDSVAADYDGPRGNNALIQDMRAELWRWLEHLFAPGARLLDLGCGTGLDAVHLARRGFRVTATDLSPAMVARTRERARQQGVLDRIEALTLGAEELERLERLERLEGRACYAGAYSDLGPLNCVPDLTAVSQQCARLLAPGGALVVTVIGRVCPWEILHYGLRGRFARLAVRFARGAVPVGMNRRTIWTRYYLPREFYRAFAPEFVLEHQRALALFAPPPYRIHLRERHPRLCRALWALERRVAGWPGLRSMGDHFLMVMRKRPPPG